MTDELPLTGGRVTAGVVRVGDTVRRPLGPHSPFVHRLLKHLEARGLLGVPRFLGIDDSGREILSFLPGDVPAELAVWPDDTVAAAARLLRQLHDATQSCEARGGADIICHGDPSPCNFVFTDGVPTGLIDFDAAHAGRRRDDVGYAAWLWLSVGNADLLPEAIGRQLRGFVAAYAAFDLDDAVPAILDVQAQFASRASSPVEHRRWAERCRAWLRTHEREVTRALRGGARG